MSTMTNLNNEIFAQGAIEGLCNILLPLSRFARNFSPGNAQRGDQLLVPLISTLTATTFNGSYAVCGGTKTVATVNLTNHRVVQVGQSDITYWSSSEANLESFGYQMGKALGTIVLSDILSLVTTKNFTNTTAVSLSDMGTTQLRAARLALNVANVPMEPRACIVDSVLMDQLLSVTNFVQAYMFRDSTVLSEGRVARALGMDFAEINGLFTSTTSIVGLCAHPDAIAVGMRYLQPQEPGAYEVARPVTDPETGLTIGSRIHFDPNTGTRYWNLECLFGYTVGLTNCARVLKRAD